MGGSDLTVSAIGFGCWPMGGEDYGAVDDGELAGAVDRALDSGSTLFDTAPSYGHGRAEKVLGRLLGPHHRSVVMVTESGLNWKPESSTQQNPRPTISGAPELTDSSVSTSESCMVAVPCRARATRPAVR